MNDTEAGAAGRLEAAACAVCGSSRQLRRYHRPYELKSLSEAGAFAATTDEFTGYGTIVRCADCGHVYTSPRPSERDLLKGYAECADEDYLRESSSRSINAHLSLNTIKQFVQNGRLLEVGCSVGYFLNAARVDFEVAGLDQSVWACRIARERFKLECRQEALEDANFPAGSFDVVAMIDVIEHLTRPKSAVEAAAKLLKPGGILYLVTPDIDSLSAKILGSYWWGFRPAHIQYFSEASLTRLLREAGFEVVLAKSFGRIFSYGYWLSRLRHYPAWMRAPIQAAVRAFRIDRKLLYIDTRDSIEICARKR